MAAVTIVCCWPQPALLVVVTTSASTPLDVDGGNQRYEYQDRYLCMETTPDVPRSEYRSLLSTKR